MNYTETLNRYDEIVNQCPNFERKGKTMPYTSANGHMFSLLNKDGEFGIRFSEEVKKKYIEEFNSDILKSHGATMRGYVLIPEELMQNTDKMIELLNESFEYVMSLDPK